ncbi:hypothetical protein D6821_00135 [Candidatus Parcubacteria bacterium]|nr:MAG: hypothetical protein D6821_00135 [Candidatus Parcubacteria bacterium]
MSRGRTLAEICEEFNLSPERVLAYLKSHTVLNGHELFVHRNNSQEQIYVYAPRNNQADKLPNRIWRFRMHPNLPYIWIAFPDDLTFRKIILAPVSDAHYGALAHMSKEFDEYLEWIKNSDNVFGFLTGDEMENTHQDFPPGGVFEQSIRPRKQLIQLREKLRPLAHKILFGIPGNHEWRSAKKADIDPLWVICDSLGIPYFDEPVYVDILWNGYVFTMFCQHGGGNAITKGGKLNRALRPLEFQEHVMFNIMGHVHDSILDETPCICRERKFDKDGKLVSFRLVHRKQYTVICPSFMKFFGSYAARAGYSPPSFGITVCEIYPNGDYNITG